MTTKVSQVNCEVINPGSLQELFDAIELPEELQITAFYKGDPHPHLIAVGREANKIQGEILAAHTP